MSEGFLLNPALDRKRPYGKAERAVLSLSRGRAAASVIEAWDGYRPTPLRSLERIAEALGVAAVLYKDEGLRFHLKSFKALGGAYAVGEIVKARGGDAASLTVTCATDGNHGRAVAWGAQRAGCRAVIYLHEGVSQGREDAIRAFGAEIRRAGRVYDESVRICAEDAAREGWQIVSDTSWPGYEDIPKDVMQGYSVMTGEAQEQGADPTHVFIQGGVGGVAAAVLSRFWESEGAKRPIIVVVEPDKAACLYESAKAGRPVVVEGDLDTIMAGLACGDPSPIAWTLLGPGIDAFMTVTDHQAEEAMRLLAHQGVVGGESGVAGLAGLRRAAAEHPLRKALGLDEASRVLLFGTEGATDPEIYKAIVGLDPEAVAEGLT